MTALKLSISHGAGQPVFLIEAFSGAAALAIELPEGKDSPKATWDYLQMVELLRTTGATGINRFRTEVENRERSMPVR